MEPLLCLACGEPLTGKQRKFCRDACRKRWHRRRIRGLEPDTEIVSFVRDWGANGRQPTGELKSRTFEVRLSIHFAADLPIIEADRILFNDYWRSRVAQLITAYLQNKNPDYQIRVEIHSRARF